MFCSLAVDFTNAGGSAMRIFFLSFGNTIHDIFAHAFPSIFKLDDIIEQYGELSHQEGFLEEHDWTNWAASLVVINSSFFNRGSKCSYIHEALSEQGETCMIIPTTKLRCSKIFGKPNPRQLHRTMTDFASKMEKRDKRHSYVVRKSFGEWHPRKKGVFSWFSFTSYVKLCGTVRLCGLFIFCIFHRSLGTGKVVRFPFSKYAKLLSVEWSGEYRPIDGDGDPLSSGQVSLYSRFASILSTILRALTPNHHLRLLELEEGLTLTYGKGDERVLSLHDVIRNIMYWNLRHDLVDAIYTYDHVKVFLNAVAEFPHMELSDRQLEAVLFVQHRIKAHLKWLSPMSNKRKLRVVVFKELEQLLDLLRKDCGQRYIQQYYSAKAITQRLKKLEDKRYLHIERLCGAVAPLALKKPPKKVKVLFTLHIFLPNQKRLIMKHFAS